MAGVARSVSVQAQAVIDRQIASIDDTGLCFGLGPWVREKYSGPSLAEMGILRTVRPAC
jgi:hypothetical protein